MMLTITQRDLNNQHIVSALHKLENCGHFDQGYGFRIAKFTEVVRREMKKTQAQYMKLIVDYVQTDEKGNPQFAPGAPGQQEFVYKEGQKEAYDTAFNLLMDASFDVKVHKVPLAMIERAGLSPSELLALEMIIDVPPDEDETAETPKPGLKVAE